MNFRKLGNTGLSVSALGLGCMRFPNDSKGRLDEEYGAKLIRAAIDDGVNYMDTGYPYHGGRSEVILGKALKDGYREKTIVATKCPMGQMSSTADFDRVLQIQLDRLDLPSVDSYMFHGLERSSFDNKVVKYGLLDKMEEARANGKIKYIGFSFHDSYDSFMHIIDSYDWDFAQVQMNYIDIEYQATLKGVKEAGERGIGIIAMEPLLGGKLANLSQAAANLIDPAKSAVEWALDFLWNLPEMSIVLSGMSSFEQLQQNIIYASRSDIGMLSEENIEMLMKVRNVYNGLLLAPCTRCKYCMPCPAGIDIPRALKAYNSTATGTFDEALAYYNRQVPVGASECLNCKHCEEECPQHIKVSELMAEISEIFRR
ncbi:MAG: aldo/keto reductase [Oscillospiraceae bacterium]|nr:aldo/keto reductase [Oscillospiraceae bacterium]